MVSFRLPGGAAARWNSGCEVVASTDPSLPRSHAKLRGSGPGNGVRQTVTGCPANTGQGATALTPTGTPVQIPPAACTAVTAATTTAGSIAGAYLRTGNPGTGRTIRRQGHI